MLRNSADARRCSYFELGLPVLSFVLNGRMFGTRQLKHDRITLRHRRQTNLLRLFSEKWHSLLLSFARLIDQLFFSGEQDFFCKKKICQGGKRSTFLTAIISTNSVSSRICYTPANRNWASISQWRITTSPFLKWLNWVKKSFLHWRLILQFSSFTLKSQVCR